MYGDPARIPAGCLKTYVHDLRIPGTMPHILKIVRDWFAEMAKLEAALPRVPGIPALLLWGDRDGAVDPASAAPLQRVLPRSELYMVPGGGHILFEEFPQQTNCLLLDWLQRGTLSSPPTEVAAPGRPHGMCPASIPAVQL
jgi:pimeloyl-ACP methyl ester carboxylesterase